MSASAWFRALVAVVALLCVLPATASASSHWTPGAFELVGHEPLMNRGMNAALAVHGNYVYVGSRTDGGHPDMPHGGVMVVDVSNPS